MEAEAINSKKNNGLLKKKKRRETSDPISNLFPHLA
jgi:hypothetical protein